MSLILCSRPECQTTAGCKCADKAGYVPPPRPVTTGGAAEGWQVQPLQWSEHWAPNNYCSYDHCFADTPFGRYQIEWKSWKDYPTFTIEGPGAFFSVAGSLEVSKTAAQTHLEHNIRAMLSAAPSPSTPVVREEKILENHVSTSEQSRENVSSTGAVARLLCALEDIAYVAEHGEPVNADEPHSVMNWIKSRAEGAIDKAPQSNTSALLEALEFYADPETYHAIAILPDRPAGEFADDFSEVEEYDRPMPGKLARAALGSLREAIEERDAQGKAPSQQRGSPESSSVVVHEVNAELLGALKPFAAFAEMVAKDHPGWDHDGFSFGGGMTLTLAPFRKAREVYARAEALPASPGRGLSEEEK